MRISDWSSDVCSSDLDAAQTKRVKQIAARLIQQVGAFRPDALKWNWQVHVLKSDQVNAWCMPGGKIAVYSGLIKKINPRSEEHTSELQSLMRISYAVFCLKKKNYI